MPPAATCLLGYTTGLGYAGLAEIGAVEEAVFGEKRPPAPLPLFPDPVKKLVFFSGPAAPASLDPCVGNWKLFLFLSFVDPSSTGLVKRENLDL